MYAKKEEWMACEINDGLMGRLHSVDHVGQHPECPDPQPVTMVGVRFWPGASAVKDKTLHCYGAMPTPATLMRRRYVVL
jgi:hypothetical protein